MIYIRLAEELNYISAEVAMHPRSVIGHMDLHPAGLRMPVCSIPRHASM